jgi:Ser/Thr protein kinase RdoA (MazF antagonist)
LTDDEGMAVSSLLTSLLPGRLLASAPARVDPHSVIAKLAELDCALAGFSDPLARRRILWDVAHADAVRVHLDAIEDKQLRSLCADALDGWEERAAPVLPSLRGQTIHNDFNPSNILVDQSGAISGIIDFGDLIEAPLVCDLATMLAYLAPKEDLGTALAAPLSVYIELLPLGLSEIRILPDLIAARAAMVVAIASWRSALRPQDRRYLVRNIPVAGRVLAAWAAAGPETLGDWLAERTEARGASR